MELVYSMRRKPLKCEPPHFERPSDTEVVRPICTISCSNIIAFSSPTELSDADCDTWGGHVYVCDLDTPWASHKVVSTTHPVSALEWDGEGKQLLVATTEGDVSVFGQKDYLLNDWTCLYSVNFPGEHIVKGVFFHNGRRLVALDKKLDAPITERIQALRYTPTLKGFGGVAIPGACIITGTGLVGAFTSESCSSASDSLRAHRDHVTHASFSHKNGSLLIAAVCVSGSGRACVRCCMAGVSRAGVSRAGVSRTGVARSGAAPSVVPTLTLTPLPTLCVNFVPTCISWCVREDADSLLVGGSSLTLWKLSERQHTIHKLLAKGPLQGSTTPGGGQKTASDCFNTVVWQQTSVWGVCGAGRVASSVCGARGVCGGAGGGAGGAMFAALAAGSVVHAVNVHNHHYICSRAVQSSGSEAAAASPPKKSRYGNGHTASPNKPLVSCVELACMGGGVVALDTRAQLHVFKLLHDNIPPPLYVQQLTSMLEFALVSGYDALDLLLTLKPNMVEAVYERLTETFQRQPAAFQQYYYHTWLKMRIALCRLIPSASTSVSWLTCLCMLWAAWAACVSSLRPDDRPDDKLLAALLDEHHNEHNQALIALESKSELPSEMQVVSGLRRPLQRAADIAITALAAAAHHTNPATQGHHGYELWADPVAIALLRKLVVVARGAGAGGADIAVSRLLARIHQHNKPEFIEEVCVLSAVYSARVWEALPRVAVSAPHNRTLPLYCEYGTEPESLRVTPSPPGSTSPSAAPSTPTPSSVVHSDVTPAHDMDAIRYMYLGLGGKWRACGRCGGRALPSPHPARHPAQRAHDARFTHACRCGGKWTLVSIV